MNTHSGRFEFDELCAQKVMGWHLVGGDWKEGTIHRWTRFFRPSMGGEPNGMVWRECLRKARDLGYELKQTLDKTDRFHINGDHPVARRLLVIDPDYNIAVCRFGALLFDFNPPPPYNFNPGEKSDKP